MVRMLQASKSSTKAGPGGGGVGNGIFRVLVTSKTLILLSMWILHPLEEYNNPRFFDLPLSISRNNAFSRVSK